MKQKRGVILLAAFYFVYFIYMGFSTFASKYYDQIGLTASQIGILNSVPALVAMCFMPMWGSLSDRMKRKKTLIVINMILGGLCLLLIDFCTDFSKIDTGAETYKLLKGATVFLPMLAILTANSFFNQPVSPIAASISLEHAESVGSSYGPIRMMGTVGYMVGSLVIGFAFTDSLRYLYAWMAIGMIATGVFALTMPNVSGHQHDKQKISPLAVLRDKRIRFLLALVFIATCTTMFYQSFFGAFLGVMGVTNKVTTVNTWVSVALEIPMLFFSSKIMKRCSIWTWIIIGYVLNGIRWLGFFVAAKMGSWQMLIGFQLLAVTANATFEIFPTLYLGSIIAPELSSSAQTMLNLTSFGIARVIGTLLGGVVCDWLSGGNELAGYGRMFALWGCVLLAAAVIFLPMCRKYAKQEKQAA